MRILLKDGCTCKAEQDGTRKGILNADQHIAKHTPVAFINDKHDAFFANQVYLRLCNTLFRVDITHLLNRSNNQSVARIVALEFAHQDGGVLRVLHLIAISCKAAIFIERLNAQFDAVHQENDFVGIA